MPRKFSWWPVIVLVLVILGIAAYNIWAYNCGYCAIKDMKTIGPQVKAVALLVLGGGVAWSVLLARRLLSQPRQHCSCGRHLLDAWLFCPDCGGALEKTPRMN